MKLVNLDCVNEGLEVDEPKHSDDPYAREVPHDEGKGYPVDRHIIGLQHESERTG